MPDPIRVLVVDDSAFMRRAVQRMLEDMPEVRVVGTASNGAEALEEAKRHRPDVVILDVNMPEMDGLEALRLIMSENPTNVLMLSTLTREGAETTLTALDLGAIDFLDKTSAGTAMDIYDLAPRLREKVLAVAGATRPPPALEGTRPIKPAAPRTNHALYDVAVIGASTGGPRALSEVLCRLPRDFPIGIVIAQHMPPGFTHTLAERLDRRCSQEVREAYDGAVVRAGSVWLAPGGEQATLARADGRLVVRVEPSTTEDLHRPSVDLLFRSTAETVGGRSIAVVLTGMGDDGAEGLRLLREAGARTLVESEESAVIYGMPRMASGSAERVLPLDLIGPALAELASTGQWGGRGS